MKTTTFIFDSSWLSVMTMLSAESRWRIILAINEYASNSAVSLPLSESESVAFDFIRPELDRQMTKRREISEIRRKAASGRRKSDIPFGTEQKQANAVKCSAEKETKKEKENLPHTPSKEKEINKEKEADAVQHARSQATPFNDDLLIPSFFGPRNQLSIEALSMRLRTDPPRLRKMAEEIVAQWKHTGKHHKDYHDASSHLYYCLERFKDRQENATAPRPCTSSATGLGIGEYIDPQGRRTYNGRQFVPHDAPPRPGKAFWWSDRSHQWEDAV